MNCLATLTRWSLAAAAAIALTQGAVPAAAQSEVVLTATGASTLAGDWHLASDSTAAGGTRIWNPDRGAAKLSSPAASPRDYVEFTFSAEAGRGYRLWMRARADHNSWQNDSVYAQFDKSVDAAGSPRYRIGTGSATSLSVEACHGCGVYNWGWEDDEYGGDAPLIYFASSGPQRLRIQRREDGISIDQIVLSASQYRTSAPGAAKGDTTILGSSTGSTGSESVSAPSGSQVVLRESSATMLRGGSYAHTNFGSAPELATRVSSDPTYTRRIQMKFDTHNTIPMGTPIASAKLTLTVSGGNAETRQLTVYRSTSPYTESQATWYSRKAGIPWSTAGGELTEQVARQSATNTPGSKVSFDVTAAVQNIVNGRYSTTSRWARFVVADMGASSRDGYKEFYSDEAGDVSVRPVLTITLGSAANSPAPAPEPEPAPAPAPAPAPEPDPQPSGSGVKLRVLEWNVHHGVGTDNRYDIDRLATWMARLNPHVIMLNEVEKYTSWGNEDQPARFKALLEAKTGRRWYSHFTQEFGQWSSPGKGHQILSVYPLESKSHTTTTPSAGLRGAGAVSQATIHVNGRTINLFVAHLDPYDQSMRLTQAREVLRWASGFAENRILGGDMNAWPDQSSIAEINKSYYDSWTAAANQGTATGISGISPFGATKKGRIDYIFYSRNASNLVVLESRTPDTRDGNGYMPSDHRPVLTTFEVR